MNPWIPRVALAAAGGRRGLRDLSRSPWARAARRRSRSRGGPEVQNLIAGIRQEEERLGSPDAAVEIELFTDVRSVPGADFQAEVVDPVIEEYVRSDRALINLRHFSFGRTAVTEAAIAADAAGAQGHQWQYAELVLRNLGNAGDGRGRRDVPQRDRRGDARARTRTSGRSSSRTSCRRSAMTPDYESAVDADGELAFELKLPAAPAMVVTGPGGSERLLDGPTLDEVRLAIERVEVPPGLISFGLGTAPLGVVEQRPQHPGQDQEEQQQQHREPEQRVGQRELLEPASEVDRERR